MSVLIIFFFPFFQYLGNGLMAQLIEGGNAEIVLFLWRDEKVRRKCVRAADTAAGEEERQKQRENCFYGAREEKGAFVKRRGRKKGGIFLAEKTKEQRREAARAPLLIPLLFKTPSFCEKHFLWHKITRLTSFKIKLEILKMLFKPIYAAAFFCANFFSQCDLGLDVARHNIKANCAKRKKAGRENEKALSFSADRRNFNAKSADIRGLKKY